MPHSTEMCFTVLLCSSVLFVKLAIVSVFWAFGRDLTSFPKHPAVTPRPSLPLFSSRVSLLSCALAQLPCFHLGGSLQTQAVMVEDRATHGASEPVTMVTGGGKPVHRFLKGQPKSIGIVLMMMGICLFMFGIAIDVQSDVTTSADMYSPFWLGTLFFICGLLYLLSERKPSKKIITASLALSIISTIGVICACVDFSRAIAGLHHVYWSHLMENQTAEERDYVEQHYMAVEKMERVFFCHSLIGGILLITMTFFSRAALRSSRTQAVVVMRNLPSAD